MIIGTFIALALFLGYTVAVGLSMAATFGITAASRTFVEKEHRVRRQYKYAQDAVWLVCTATGGYVTAFIAGKTHPLAIGSALVASLIGVMWMNAWEMRQRGVGHQILLSLVTVAGVTAGFLLRLR